MHILLLLVCLLWYQCLHCFLFSYVSEFSNHAILWGVIHCKLCTSFYWHNFLCCVLWRYYQDIHSITSCIVSCFYLPWFDSKTLDILWYYDVHHKWDTLPYLSSHCLLPPSWHDSETYILLICFVVLIKDDTVNIPKIRKIIWSRVKQPPPSVKH